MKNINLLPKVPLIKRVLVPALVAAVMLAIALNAALVLFQFGLKDELQAKQAEKTRLESSISVLTAEKTMDSQTKEYLQLKADLDKIFKSRRDWVPVFQAITSNLPKTTRLLSAGTAAAVSAVPAAAQAPAAVQAAAQAPTAPALSAASTAEEKIKVKLETAVFTDSAEYIISLMTSPVVDKVNLLEVVRSKSEGVALPQGLPVKPQAPQQLFPGQLNQPVTGAEGEQLMNQLQSMIAAASNDTARAEYKYSISLEITLKSMEVARK